jgi:hypothetical protein
MDGTVEEKVFTPGYSQFRPRPPTSWSPSPWPCRSDATDGRPKSTWTVST